MEFEKVFIGKIRSKSIPIARSDNFDFIFVGSGLIDGFLTIPIIGTVLIPTLN
jgi:hypothetical protein